MLALSALSGILCGVMVYVVSTTGGVLENTTLHSVSEKDDKASKILINITTVKTSKLLDIKLKKKKKKKLTLVIFTI